MDVVCFLAWLFGMSFTGGVITAQEKSSRVEAVVAETLSLIFTTNVTTCFYFYVFFFFTAL